MEKKKTLPRSANEALATAQPDKPKRGRPKTSPYDLATQRKLNSQRHRQAKREGNEVPVEIYLPREWHDWLLNVQGVNLREVGLEAFAAWMKKRGFSAGEPPGRPTVLPVGEGGWDNHISRKAK